MPAWQIPGVPAMPTMGDMVRIMQLQTETMTQLPETLAELTRAVRGLAETVENTKETVAAANRVVERLEALLDELHDPVHGLRPGIERVSEVLEAPVVQRLPAILESVEGLVLPVARRAERVRLRLSELEGRRRQLVCRLRGT
jgi:hypothetical protein